MTLEEHLEKLARGDDSDFDAFYLATKKTVYHIALGVLRERALAEDAMQNTYVRIIGNAHKFRAGGSAAAWVGRIARNEALNLRKKGLREVPTDESEDPSLFGKAEPNEYGYVTDVARRTLTEGEFTVLMLAAADGYLRREIAAMLGVPLPTVTWRYHRALSKMRKALEGEENGRS